MPETPEDAALIEAIAQAIHDTDDMADTVWPDGDDDNGYRGGDGWVRLCLNPETYRLAARQVVRITRAHDASAQAAEITALRAAKDYMVDQALALRAERDALAARLAVPDDDKLKDLLSILSAFGAVGTHSLLFRRAHHALTALRARVAGLEGARVAARKALDAWDWWYEEETNVDMPVIAMEDLRQALHTLSPSAAQEACDNG